MSPIRSSARHLGGYGVLLLTQSVLNGVDTTQAMLEVQGLSVEIAAQTQTPFGRMLSARAELFEARGLIHPAGAPKGWWSSTRARDDCCDEPPMGECVLDVFGGQLF